MADIAAGGVTYSLVKDNVSQSRYEAVFDLSFGDGTDTYPAGGVPLTKAKLGCPADLQEFMFVEDSAGDGYIYKYDASAEKIRIYFADYDAGADGALIELSGGSTAVAAATLRVKVVGY